MTKKFNWKNFGEKKSKFNAVKCESDGIKFDSKMEMEFYHQLKLDPEVEHIDFHVGLMLPGGVKYRVDFIAWYRDGRIRPVEVKGSVESDFRIKWKLFNQFHPLAPLEVIKKKGKQWITMEP